MDRNDNSFYYVGDGSVVYIEPKLSSVSWDYFHECGHRYLGQLGQIQEYREALAKKLRSLPHHLDHVDSLARVAGSFAAVTVILDGRDTGIADPEPIQPSLCAPSLHLPPSQVLQMPDGRMSWDELCAVLEQIPHDGTQVVRERLRREIRWTTSVIAVLLLALCSAVPFFCSLRWERRRWFLYHGSRPPKPTPQAMLGLFGGACSRPSFAN